MDGKLWWNGNWRLVSFLPILPNFCKLIFWMVSKVTHIFEWHFELKLNNKCAFAPTPTPNTFKSFLLPSTGFRDRFNHYSTYIYYILPNKRKKKLFFHFNFDRIICSIEIFRYLNVPICAYVQSIVMICGLRKLPYMRIETRKKRKFTEK